MKKLSTMNILVLNSILFTANNNIIPQVISIKDTMIYNMCLGFLNAGHHVTLVAASEYKPIQQEEYEFDIIFLPSILKRFLLPSVLPLQPHLWHFLRKQHKNYDWVVTSETFAFPSLFATLLCPKKTIIWQEMISHQRKFRKIPSKIWHNIIVPLFMYNVKIVIPRSEQARSFIRRYFRNVSQEIVDHGVNEKNFKMNDKKKKQIICVSQLIPRKNIGGIIDIFSRFVRLEGYEDIKLYIMGRGELRDQLEQKTQDLELSDNIIFGGFMDHKTLNEYIRNSYAFLVNTSQDLNLVSIPESIVSGTPILTNMIPTSTTYIIANKLGIAKDEWNEYDIKDIIDNNSFYVQNCKRYRYKLTNVYSCERLIKAGNT